MKIENVRVYDLEESVIACRNAMRTSLPTYTKEEFNMSLERAKKLVSKSKKTDVHCHDNFLTGIRVSFDITYPQYWSMQAQRYHFFDIVTSSSKMHSLRKMKISECCNPYVDSTVIANEEYYIDQYNVLINNREDIIKTIGQEAYFKSLENMLMLVLSNCPMGLELFERCSTNYKQLQTIYYQRRNHRLPEWREFCKWIETLPYANELILGNDEAVDCVRDNG